MGRAVITIKDERDRIRAARWCAQMPFGGRVEFKDAKRSLPQNDRFWASLTDVATQVLWHGQRLTPEDWKYVFLDALKREMRIVPNIDGNGFVNLGRSSSKLSVAEMTDLIDLIHAFGAQHGVEFHDPAVAA